MRTGGTMTGETAGAAATASTGTIGKRRRGTTGSTGTGATTTEKTTGGKKTGKTTTAGTETAATMRTTGRPSAIFSRRSKTGWTAEAASAQCRLPAGLDCGEFLSAQFRHLYTSIHVI